MQEEIIDSIQGNRRDVNKSFDELFTDHIDIFFLRIHDSKSEVQEYVREFMTEDTEYIQINNHPYIW